MEPFVSVDERWAQSVHFNDFPKFWCKIGLCALDTAAMTVFSVFNCLISGFFWLSYCSFLSLWFSKIPVFIFMDLIWISQRHPSFSETYVTAVQTRSSPTNLVFEPSKLDQTSGRTTEWKFSDKSWINQYAIDRLIDRNTSDWTTD